MSSKKSSKVGDATITAAEARPFKPKPTLKVVSKRTMRREAKARRASLALSDGVGMAQAEETLRDTKTAPHKLKPLPSALVFPNMVRCSAAAAHADR